MVNAAVSDDIASGLGISRRITPTFGYYRQSNGWITISPNTRLERLKYTEQGWTYLEQYGAFDMTTYTASHPFDGLFMFGGAKEMPVAQVIETGLYIEPRLVPRCKQHLTQYHRSHGRECWAGAVRVEFPQLEGVAKELIGPFVCDFCKRKMPTVDAREQHQSVAHARTLGNVQLGQTLGDTLAGALGRHVPEAGGLTNIQARRLAELEAKEEARRAKGRENAKKYPRKAKKNLVAS